MPSHIGDRNSASWLDSFHDSFCESVCRAQPGDPYTRSKRPIRFPASFSMRLASVGFGDSICSRRSLALSVTPDVEKLHLARETPMAWHQKRELELMLVPEKVMPGNGFEPIPLSRPDPKSGKYSYGERSLPGKNVVLCWFLCVYKGSIKAIKAVTIDG